jgi:hypothetical protein
MKAEISRRRVESIVMGEASEAHVVAAAYRPVIRNRMKLKEWLRGAEGRLSP